MEVEGGLVSSSAERPRRTCPRAGLA